ncbi:MAG TPA: type II toxin-antitoxin system VapC family toxin, partial [Candidatus Eisenbacteria bacterium]
ADTDVLIDFLHGVEPGAGRIAAELETGQLRTTVVSRVELLAGARSPRQETVIRELLAAVPSLPLDDAAAEHAGRVRRELDAAGSAIGLGDCLIAGIALANQAILLTRNRQHFEPVSGLSLGTLST